MDKKKEKLTSVLIWQWGRRGAGPKIAVEMTKAFKAVSVHSRFFLSLSERAEINLNKQNNLLDIPIQTYSSVGGYIFRLLMSPFIIRDLYHYFQKFKIRIAICTMPGLLDIVMILTLKLLRIPYAIIIHDAYPHPGEQYFLQYYLQKYSIKYADVVITFSDYVYNELRYKHKVSFMKLVKAWHPPLSYHSKKECDSVRKREGNKIHLLNFGRLLSYKGFSLLDQALDLVTEDNFTFRIVGQGPSSHILSKLNARKNVTVENRWVPEEEVISIIQWADAIILPYEEASQSGVLAIALAFRKPVLITKVGGLIEQGKDYNYVFPCEPTPESVAKGINQILNLSFPLQIQSEVIDTAKEWENMASHILEQINEKLSLSL